MIRLHDNLSSGNGYKVRLLLAQLGLPHERIEYDIDRGETRTPVFLREINANGRVPVLETEAGEFLPESNAILCYLAEGTPFLPKDSLVKARLLSWMFFEQYSHEPNVATPRFWATHGIEMTEERRIGLRQKRELGYAALGVMENHLAENDFLVAEDYTVADIALYAYTHVADEGGFDLAPYPAVRAWIARVASQPGYVAITEGA